MGSVVFGAIGGAAVGTVAEVVNVMDGYTERSIASGAIRYGAYGMVGGGLFGVIEAAEEAFTLQRAAVTETIEDNRTDL